MLLRFDSRAAFLFGLLYYYIHLFYLNRSVVLTSV